MNARFGLLVCVSGWLLSGHASAEPSSASKAISSQLFDEATKLAAAKNFAEACPKFLESNRQDPHLGTQLNLADCYQNSGKTASAWVAFKDAADLAAQQKDGREARIRKRIAELEPKLSKLVVTVASPAPGLEVMEDGELLNSSVWGSAVPIDQGSHTVSASAPGFKPWAVTVVVAGDGQTVRADVPALVAEPAPAPAPVVAPAPTAPAAPVAPAPVPTAASGSTQRALGYTAVGLGAVGLVVGVVFEVTRSNKLSDRDKICPNGVGCTQADQVDINSLTSQAKSASTIGTVGLISGGVLAAAGVALVLTAPSSKTKVGALTLSPVLAPGFRGLSLATNLW